ncbi:MsnO8 family LLM class oxidoreductase [Deinococcus malanensis]|uniref:MsnO8 family LLM class oxidoreductase n=1 Tax=Deinococcus malanensis TaxID=1706855 RepID=UPI00363085F9
MALSIPLSLLDLTRVKKDEPTAEGIARSVRLARTADRLGYHRLWFAEHHNAPTIASSATSLMIQHVAAQTENLRVGAGGIMLPNHSPLVIAEQFGMLETLYPGRIDLGLGRAPARTAPPWVHCDATDAKQIVFLTTCSNCMGTSAEIRSLLA